MKNNICNFPCIITIDGDLYQCNFDHKSLDILETVMGIGFYDIYEKFILKNSLTGGEMIDLISLSTFKTHGITGVKKVKKFLSENREISLDELAVFKVHFKNLLPEITQFLDDLKMINPKHTAYDLVQMQSLPLDIKIRMTKERIRQWYEYWYGICKFFRRQGQHCSETHC